MPLFRRPPIFVGQGQAASFPRPAWGHPLVWVTASQPTNIANGDYWLSAGVTPFTGPFDTYSTPHRAYSLRRLLGSYTGAAIRVRRSSDNVEADINFNSSGDLDTTALLAHTGANSGYVVTWYDQSGNGSHVTQATAASQPRIVNAGTTDLLGTKPSLVFDGTDDYMFSTVTGLYAASAASIAAVMAGNATATNATVVSESSTTAGAFWRAIRSASGAWNVQSSNDAGTSLWANTAAGSAIFNDAAHQLFYAEASAAINTWKDTTAVHTALTATRSGVLTPTRFALGAHVGSTVVNYSTAKMQEVVAWTSDRTGDRTALSTNQKTYWGTP